jgi:hypothetical protein
LITRKKDEKDEVKIARIRAQKYVELPKTTNNSPIGNTKLIDLG